MGVNTKQCQVGSVIRTSGLQQSVHIPASASGFIVASVTNPAGSLSPGDMLTIVNNIVTGVSINFVPGDNSGTDLALSMRVTGLNQFGVKVTEDVAVAASTEAQSVTAWSYITSIEMLAVAGTSDVNDSFAIGTSPGAAMNIGVPAAVTSASYTIFDAADGTVEATTATDDTNRTCRVASTSAGDEFLFRFDPGNPDL